MSGELDACGACAAAGRATPVEPGNPPGLSLIPYRAGTHPQFMSSMLAALASSRYPALANLLTRERGDFSIALLDAFACMSDVLTFYQERIANESYLRTATERRSILEMARLIGYELRPGVAAGAWLAFELEGDKRQLELEPGVKVQSVPGPGQSPQTFETVEKLDARIEWNALRPRLRQPQVLRPGDSVANVTGLSNPVKPGDLLVFVGPQKLADSQSDRWNVRRATKVELDTAARQTVVTWNAPLDQKLPADARMYVFRLRSSVYGHNAPDWRTQPKAMRQSYLDLDESVAAKPQDQWDWPSFRIHAPEFPARQMTLSEIRVLPTKQDVAKAAIDTAKAEADLARKKATDEAVDAAKAAAKYVHKLLTLPSLGTAMAGGIGDVAPKLTTLLEKLKLIPGAIESVKGMVDKLEQLRLVLELIQGVIDNLKNFLGPGGGNDGGGGGGGGGGSAPFGLPTIDWPDAPDPPISFP